ncbi:pentapeptide repeat-containing protein [Bacillus velezensis]
MSKDKPHLKQMTQKELNEQLEQNKMFYEFIHNEANADFLYGDAAYNAKPADFTYRDLRGLEFPQNAQLTGANFEGANMSGVRLINPVLQRSDFKDADLDDFIVFGGNIGYTTFENASLERAVFEFVEGDYISFRNANCRSLDLMLSGLEKNSVDFTGADITNIKPNMKLAVTLKNMLSKEKDAEMNNKPLYIDPSYLDPEIKYEASTIYTSEDLKKELLLLKQKVYESGLDKTGMTLKDLKKEYPDAFKEYIQQYDNDMNRIKEAKSSELFDILSNEKGVLTPDQPIVNRNDLRLPAGLNKEEALKNIKTVDYSDEKSIEYDQMIKEFTLKEGIDYPIQNKELEYSLSRERLNMESQNNKNRQIEKRKQQYMEIER